MKETDYSEEVDEKGVKKRRRDEEGMALLNISFHRTLISQNDSKVLDTQNINQ